MSRCFLAQRTGFLRGARAGMGMPKCVLHSGCVQVPLTFNVSRWLCASSRLRRRSLSLPGPLGDEWPVVGSRSHAKVPTCDLIVVSIIAATRRQIGTHGCECVVCTKCLIVPKLARNVTTYSSRSCVRYGLSITPGLCEIMGRNEDYPYSPGEHVRFCAGFWRGCVSPWGPEGFRSPEWW